MSLMSKSAALLLCATVFTVEAQPIEVETQETTQAETFTKAARPPATDPTQVGDRGGVKPQNPAAAKVEPVPVPEPAHYKLILLGIAILLLFARRDAPRDEPWTK
ncbi:MAG: PEP-CTERM sorting domain-containing protein [Pseudomonadota bacterium]